MNITIKQGEKSEKQQTQQILKTLNVGIVVYYGVDLLYVTNIHKKIEHRNYLSNEIVQCFFADVASFFPDVLLAASLVMPNKARTAGTS